MYQEQFSPPPIERPKQKPKERLRKRVLKKTGVILGGTTLIALGIDGLSAIVGGQTGNAGGLWLEHDTAGSGRFMIYNTVGESRLLPKTEPTSIVATWADGDRDYPGVHLSVGIKIQPWNNCAFRIGIAYDNNPPHPKKTGLVFGAHSSSSNPLP